LAAAAKDGRESKDAKDTGKDAGKGKSNVDCLAGDDVQEIQIEIPMEYINKWNKNNNAAASTASSHV